MKHCTITQNAVLSDTILLKSEKQPFCTVPLFIYREGPDTTLALRFIHFIVFTSKAALLFPLPNNTYSIYICYIMCALIDSWPTSPLEYIHHYNCKSSNLSPPENNLSLKLDILLESDMLS